MYNLSLVPDQLIYHYQCVNLKTSGTAVEITESHYTGFFLLEM